MLALLTVASLLPAHATAQQQPPPYGRNHRRESQREVEAIEQQLRQAELHGDAATLDRYLADDYMGITSNGILMSREQTIARLKSGQLVIRKLDLSEVKVNVHGTTAIVTCRADIESTQSGLEHDGIFRYTRVYQLRPGGWKIVNFEATRINPAAPGSSPDAPPTTPAPATPAANPPQSK